MRRPPLDRALILAGWAGLALLLRPFQDVPFIDDWVYGWAVQNLLATGRLELLDYYGNLMHGQVLWGAAFCLPLGFSFATLRISTWVLSAVALAGMHRLLIEAGASRRGALLGTATLAAYPIFFILSFTFMTEVPSLALETWALAFFLRARRCASDRSLWAGTACAALGAAIRFVNVVPALAMSTTLLFATDSWGRRRGRFLTVSLFPSAILLLLAWYTASHTRHVADLTYISNAPGARLELLRQYALPLLPRMLLDSVNTVSSVIGLALLPAAAGLAVARRQLAGIAIGLVLAAGSMLTIVAMGERPFVLLGPAQVWSLEELGAARSFLPAWAPLALAPVLTIAATLLAWAALAVGAGSAWRRAPEQAGTPVLWWTSGGLLLMTALLWLTYDRYLLPFVPPALALALGRGAQVSWRRAAVLVVAWLAVSVTGTRDHLELQRATWAAVDELRARGVAESRLDAGYVVNGWLQYAHPEHAARDAEGRVAVPMVNGGPDLPWVVGLGPLPGTRVSREYAFDSWWGHPGRVVVLERR